MSRDVSQQPDLALLRDRKGTEPCRGLLQGGIRGREQSGAGGADCLTDAELLVWDEEAPGEPLTYDEWEQRRQEKLAAVLRKFEELPLQRKA